VNEEFLKNILNKNIIYIKDKINSIPLIYTNLLEKTITIKKNKFNIVGLMCRGASKQIFLLKNNNRELVYRCPLIKLDNDTLIVNNYTENFIHLFLSNLNKNKILKVYYLGFNPEYHFIASFIEKMDGTLYGYLKREDLDFETKTKVLIKELYEIASLLEELQDEYKFVHNDLKCDNILYKGKNFYIGDFDNTTMTKEEFNPKKDLFILTQSLFLSFNFDFFKKFPLIQNIKTQNEFHKLYQYKNIDDIYLPKNYKKILKGIII